MRELRRHGRIAGACLRNLCALASLAASGMLPAQSVPASLAAAHAAEAATDVVDMIFKASGATAIYSNSRIERCFRDVNMVTQHVTTNISNFESGGRYFLERIR